MPKSYFAGDGGREETEEVAKERAVEVGNPQPVARQRDSRLSHLVRLEWESARSVQADSLAVVRPSMCSVRKLWCIL